MKFIGKILSGGVLTALALGSVAFAQKADFSLRSFKQEPNIAQSLPFGEIKVLSDGKNGTLFSFTTVNDGDVLGYNIYAVSPSGKSRLLNETLLEGGLFDARSAQKDFSREIKFLSTDKRIYSQFFIEVVKSDGIRLRSGIVAAQAVKNLGSLAENARRNIPSKSYTASETPILETIENAPELRGQENSLQSRVESFDNSPQFIRQQWIAGQPAAKIAVKRDGFYRVSRQELVNAGFNVNTPNNLWQLYLNGNEQPISVGDGGAYIEFYGRGLNTAENDTNIYYLVATNESGRRIGLQPLRYADLTEQANFRLMLNKRDRKIYSNVIMNGEAENWYGGIIYWQPQTVTLDVYGIDTSLPTVDVEIGVQGFSTNEHRTQVKLNGTEIAVIENTGRSFATASVTVPTGLLREGANSISYLSLNPNDTSLIDYFRLSYAKNYVATNNQLTATVPHRRRARIKGFSTPSVRVFDITDESNIKRIRSKVVAENGGYTVEIPADRPRKIFAVADDALQSASQVRLNVASDWSNGQRNPQFLIITPRDFRPAAEELAAFRRLEGLTVEVAEVEDLYDEFSFGLQTWTALRETIRTMRPTYTLFLADSTIDPRGFYSNIPAANIIPTKLFEGFFAEAVSDELIGDLTQDSLSESNLGRLPVKSLAEATAAVNKIKAFETNSARLSRGNLFISDAPDGYDFYASNEFLRSLLPAGTPSKHLSRLDGTVDVVRANIITEVNRGYYFVTYSGHGSAGGWSNSPQMFTNADVTSLSNTNARSSIFLILNCLNGAFAEISTDSLTENLLKNNNGGAVLSWASTTLTVPDIQEAMFGELYRQINGGTSSARSGAAFRAAKEYIPCDAGSPFSCDIRASWVAIGDPTTRIR